MPAKQIAPRAARVRHRLDSRDKLAEQIAQRYSTIVLKTMVLKTTVTELAGSLAKPPLTTVRLLALSCAVKIAGLAFLLAGAPKTHVRRHARRSCKS